MTEHIVLTVAVHSQHVIDDLIAGDFAVGYDPAADQYVVVGHNDNPETLTNGRFTIQETDNEDVVVLNTETNTEINRFCTTPENNQEITINITDLEETVVSYLSDSYTVNYDKHTDTYVIN